MASHILVDKNKGKSYSTATPVSKNELLPPQTNAHMDKYTNDIESIIGNFSHSTTNKLDSPTGEDSCVLLFEEDDLPDENDTNINTEIKYEDNNPPCVDNNIKMINTKVPLQRNGIREEGIVRSHKRDCKRMCIGMNNSNPISDLREYEVQFPDRSYPNYSSKHIN